MLCSCVKDDIENCPSVADFYFVYMRASKNSFDTEVKSDLSLYLYKEQADNFRKEEVIKDEVTEHPLQLQKTVRKGLIDVVSWSHDPAVEYVSQPDPSVSVRQEAATIGGYVQLKSISTRGGLRVCRPVDDLFYGRTNFETDRYTHSKIIVPHTRAVCRIVIELIPSSVQNQTRASLPEGNPGDYQFLLYGTGNRLDFDNQPCGEEVILDPPTYFNETSRRIVTNWFGAFPLAKIKTDSDTDVETKQYMSVDIYRKGIKVASFDCAPLELEAKAEKYYELIIDGKYSRPELSIYVNGWKLATVVSNM